MKGRLCLTAVSMLMLTLGSLSALVPTASGQGAWTTMADTPDPNYPIGMGGSLTYASSDYIYAFQGHAASGETPQIAKFWRYSISGNAWTSMADAPSEVAWGGALTWAGGDYIYALRGNGTTDFWCYSISGGSWETMAATPSAVGEGGALTHDGQVFVISHIGEHLFPTWSHHQSDRFRTARFLKCPSVVYPLTSLCPAKGKCSGRFPGATNLPAQCWFQDILQDRLRLSVNQIGIVPGYEPQVLEKS
jgi:hypothetical protein